MLWTSSRTCAACLGIWAAISLGGCESAGPSGPDVQFALSLAPSPPLVGDADVSLTLTDANGSPLEGAAVRLEGNMNHAGMKPSFSELREVGPGQYAGTLAFTMGGDWFILVTAETPDGESVERKVDVRGVKSE